MKLDDGKDACSQFMEDAKKELDSCAYGLEDAKMQIMQLLLINNHQKIGFD